MVKTLWCFSVAPKSPRPGPQAARTALQRLNTRHDREAAIRACHRWLWRMSAAEGGFAAAFERELSRPKY